MLKKQFSRFVKILTEDLTGAENELNRLERFAHFWVLVGKSFARSRCPIRAAARTGHRLRTKLRPTSTQKCANRSSRLNSVSAPSWTPVRILTSREYDLFAMRGLR